MQIRFEAAIHEAGHLVIGYKLGLAEGGVHLRPLPPRYEALAEFSERKSDDRKDYIARAFAGLHAHLYLSPNTLAEHHRSAFRHSIYVTEDHPHYASFSTQDLEYLSGASDDMEIARNIAKELKPNNPESLMHAAEAIARDLVQNYANEIYLIGKDIVAYGLAAPDGRRQVDYPFEDALRIIHHEQAELE